MTLVKLKSEGKVLVQVLLAQIPFLHQPCHSKIIHFCPSNLRPSAIFIQDALGWIMFVGMAMAKYWDVDWELYSKVEDHYTHLRDSKDFDHMDVEIL